jgi:hypothetical protein
MRWLSVLAEYDLKIQYLPGAENNLADYLSRKDKEVNVRAASYLNVLAVVKAVLEGKIEVMQLPKRLRKNVVSKLRRFYLDNGNLYRISNIGQNQKIIFDKMEKQQLLDQAHRGHARSRAMFEEISENYYWSGLSNDCDDTVNACRACLEEKPPTKKGKVGSFAASELFDTFHCDFVGPLNVTKTGNRYILVAVERASKMVIAKACKETTSSVVMDFLKNEIILKFGFPAVIVTDRGTSFTSSVTEDFLKKNAIEHIRTTSYHPQSNGQVERYNGSLKSVLGKLCRQRKEEWDVLLNHATFTLNTRKNASLGLSPFSYLYGVPAMRSKMCQLKQFKDEVEQWIARIEELKYVHTTRELRHDTAESNWKDDLGHTETSIKVGDSVLLWEPAAKIETFGQTKWKGPFTVVKIDSYGNFYLKNAAGKQNKTPVNSSRLRKILLSNERTERMEEELLGQSATCTGASSFLY